MIGPSDGIATVISTTTLDTNFTLTCGQLTNDADNQASAATTANEAPSQDTASRSITPIPPRKKLRSADDRLLNRASPVILRTANPCQSYTQANKIRTTVPVICIASLRWSQGVVYELRRKRVRRGSRARVGLVGCQPNFPNLLVCRSPRRDSACHSVRPRLWIRVGLGRWLRVGEKSWRGASMRRRVRILISTRTT